MGPTPLSASTVSSGSTWVILDNQNGHIELCLKDLILIVTEIESPDDMAIIMANIHTAYLDFSNLELCYVKTRCINQAEDQFSASIFFLCLQHGCSCGYF